MSDDEEGQASQALLYDVALALQAALIVGANVVVLKALIKSRLLQAPRYIFVATTALGDIGIGVLIWPFRVWEGQNLELTFETCISISCVFLFFCDIPVSILWGFTFDRFFAMRFPSKYHGFMSRNIAVFVVVGMLVCCGFLAFVPILMSDNLSEEYKDKCGFLTVISKSYLGEVPLYLFLATFIMLIMHVCIVRRQRKRQCPEQSVDIIDANALNSERMVFRMVGAFIACSLPLAIASQVDYRWENSSITYDTYPMCLFIFYTKSFVNPFIYFYNDAELNILMSNVLHCRNAKRRTDTTMSSSYSRFSQEETISLSTATAISEANEDLSETKHNQRH